MLKFRNVRFLGNLILSMRCDNVTVTWFINNIYDSVAAKVSRNEQRSVICFRWTKGRSTNASQSEMRPVYVDKCFTRPAIHVWCKKFAHGHESGVDEEGPGRRVVSTTDATMAAVDSLIQSDRRLMG